MSFYRIEDPVKRDAAVNDYLATLKRMQARDLEERQGISSYRQEVVKQMEPVVQSNQKMIQEIAEELKPIQAGVENLTRHIKESSLADRFRSRLLARDPDLDTSFGLYYSNDGEIKMGDKTITLDGNDLIVNDEIYEGTPGLWS